MATPRLYFDGVGCVLILAHSLSGSVDLGRVEQIDPVLIRQSHQLLGHLSQEDGERGGDCHSRSVQLLMHVLYIVLLYVTSPDNLTMKLRILACLFFSLNIIFHLAIYDRKNMHAIIIPHLGSALQTSPMFL